MDNMYVLILHEILMILKKMNMEKAIELVSNKEEKVENGLFDILTQLKQSIFKK